MGRFVGHFPNSRSFFVGRDTFLYHVPRHGQFHIKAAAVQRKSNKLWFLPAVFLVLTLIFPSHDSYIPYILYVFLYFLLDVIAFTLCSLWIAYPENLPKFEIFQIRSGAHKYHGEKKPYATGAAPAVSEAYCDLVSTSCFCCLPLVSGITSGFTE